MLKMQFFSMRKKSDYYDKFYFCNDTDGNAFHPENPKTRSRAHAQCVCLLLHQPFPSLTLFAVLGKPRKHFPATTFKPAIKAL
jgi:hypothetical protein